MNRFTDSQRFWIAVLVIAGYMLFGVAVAFIPIQEGKTIFINTVLATMGPLVGFVVRGWTDDRGDKVEVTNTPDDPVPTRDEP